MRNKLKLFRLIPLVAVIALTFTMCSNTTSPESHNDDLTAPSVPQNLAAQADSGQVTLSWTAPASNGGSAIIKYEVSADNGSWATATSPHTITGLANGTEYTFKVRAVNAIGNGPAATITAVPGAPAAPGVPQNFFAIAGNEQVTLSWTAPASSGASAIERYEVSVNSGAWTTAASPCTITELSNGIEYTFKVRAVNANGNGPEAMVKATPSAAAETDVASEPGIPLGFFASVGNGQITLSWTAPANNGGSAIIKYEVSVDSGTWAAAVSPHKITGLTNGTEYTFRVRAVNTIGNGPEATAKAAPAVPSAGLGFGYYWDYDGGAYVVYNNGITDTVVVIPEEATTAEHGLLPVRSIGESFLENNTNITKVIIPGSVREIRNFAFHGCTNLETITIPPNLGSMGTYVFWNCTSLKKITITYCSEAVLLGCTSLESLTIYHFNSFLGRAFSESFGGTVTYSNQNEYIPASLKTVTITGSENLASNAFYGCDNLTDIILEGSIASIGNNAFQNCSNLTSIILPESLTSIGEEAFRGCSGLESFVIPRKVTSIGANIFWDSYNIASLTTPFAGRTLNGTTVSDRLASFFHSSYPPASLKTVIITAGNIINSNTFLGCSDLTSITIPASVKNIGDQAFYGCSSLTSFIIPNGVTNIGDSAFSGCQKMTEITISASVVNIGTSVFTNCGSLESITVENGNPAYRSDGNCFIRSSDNMLLMGFQSSVIPEGVAIIGENAFYSCTGLKNITIPGSVTSIGKSAFFASGLENSITIPGNVMSIGDSAFFGCSGLTGITISSGVTAIGDSAFSSCSGIAGIIIPGSVTVIGESVFSFCQNLTSVSFETGSAISSANFGDRAFPEGDLFFNNNTLKTAYLAAGGGPGTYTRAPFGDTWTKQ